MGGWGRRCKYHDKGIVKRTIDNAIKEVENNCIHSRFAFRSMSPITANDLKTKGIAAIETTLAEQTEAMISVRGKDRFVVMDVEHYSYLRECELEAALAQSRADIDAGRFVQESAQAHVDRVAGRTVNATITKKSKRAA